MRRPVVDTIIVGPNALLREGLTRILGTADFRIAASAIRVDDIALTALPRQRPILLIIDAGTDLSLAIEQVVLFKERYPTGRVVMLADNNEPGDMVSAFRAGANAYFTRVARCDAFTKSLELVMLGETILPAAILSTVLIGADDDEDDRENRAAVCCEELAEPGDHGMPRLSARERCILKCLIEGDSNKAIARKIDIAEATVKVHVKAILRKIRVHNRTQAAIWAMNNGLSILEMDNGSATVAKALPPPLPLVRALPTPRRNGSGEYS
jgi:two-component system nitrate/nitrite response regulator NarL